MKNFVIILLFIFSLSCKVQEIKNTKETYAVVIDEKDRKYFELIGQPSSESTVFRFYPNGKDSLTFGYTYYGFMKAGDKYLITYDSLDPSGMGDKIVYRTKPIFLKSDITDTTYGVIAEALRNKKDNMLTYIEFKYDVFVNNDTMTKYSFTRGQQIFSKEYPTTKVGDKYKVVYLKSNPINAIIYLDKKTAE